MADQDVIEMRCKSCGMFLGYRKRIGRFVFWCSEPCAATPMSKSPEQQIRDEVMVELTLSGVKNIDIARLFDLQYQMVQQITQRRTQTEEERQAS